MFTLEPVALGRTLGSIMTIRTNVVVGIFFFFSQICALSSNFIWNASPPLGDHSKQGYKVKLFKTCVPPMEKFWFISRHMSQ